MSTLLLRLTQSSIQPTKKLFILCSPLHYSLFLPSFITSFINSVILSANYLLFQLSQTFAFWCVYFFTNEVTKLSLKFKRDSLYVLCAKLADHYDMIMIMIMTFVIASAL